VPYLNALQMTMLVIKRCTNRHFTWSELFTHAHLPGLLFPSSLYQMQQPVYHLHITDNASIMKVKEALLNKASFTFIMQLTVKRYSNVV